MMNKTISKNNLLKLFSELKDVQLDKYNRGEISIDFLRGSLGELNAMENLNEYFGKPESQKDK